MDESQLQLAMAAFRRAVAWCGGQAEFERRTGLKQQTVSYRLANDIPLRSGEEVLKVEAATGVSRHELRPDIYPIESSSPSDLAGDAAPPAEPNPTRAGGANSSQPSPGARPGDAPPAGISPTTGGGVDQDRGA